jgi:hypothetical protein
MGVWDVIAGCGRQLRAGMGSPFGLDFAAVMAMGAAQDVDRAMLADLLPRIESIILDGLDESDMEEDGSDDSR